MRRIPIIVFLMSIRILFSTTGIEGKLLIGIISVENAHGYLCVSKQTKRQNENPIM